MDVVFYALRITNITDMTRATAQNYVYIIQIYPIQLH